MKAMHCESRLGFKVTLKLKKSLLSSVLSSHTRSTDAGCSEALRGREFLEWIPRYIGQRIPQILDGSP